MIKRSIASEIWNDLTSALKISAILFSKKEIDRVIELVENKDRKKLFNAMEMLELVLPKKTARQINDLFDYILEPTLNRKRLTEVSTISFLQEIVTPSAKFNHWTKAVCLYTSFKNKKLDFIHSLVILPEQHENIVLTETRAYVMDCVKSTAYANH